MSIKDIINNITNDIQDVYEEIIKLIIKKNMIQNQDNSIINKYTYNITNDNLGWKDDIITTFKAIPKFIKSENNKLKMKESNLLTFIKMNNNKQYTIDIPYSQVYKQLENIGYDIINSNKTSLIKNKLYNLNKDLMIFENDYLDLYLDYIEMIKLINSINNEKINWVINLIAELSYKSIDDIDKDKFINILGEDFINLFINNQLIIILLQNDNSHLIMTGSYLYSIMKLLYIIFGYNQFIYNEEPDYEIIKEYKKRYSNLVNLIGDEVSDIIDTEIDIIENYDNLETIGEYLRRYSEYSYLKYLDYLTSKELEIAMNTKINNKIKYLKKI